MSAMEFVQEGGALEQSGDGGSGFEFEFECRRLVRWEEEQQIDYGLWNLTSGPHW